MRVLRKYINPIVLVRAWMGEAMFAMKIMAYGLLLLMAAGVKVENIEWLYVAVYVMPLVFALIFSIRRRR